MTGIAAKRDAALVLLATLMGCGTGPENAADLLGAWCREDASKFTVLELTASHTDPRVKGLANIAVEYVYPVGQPPKIKRIGTFAVEGEATPYFEHEAWLAITWLEADGSQSGLQTWRITAKTSDALELDKWDPKATSATSFTAVSGPVPASGGACSDGQSGAGAASGTDGGAAADSDGADGGAVDDTSGAGSTALGKAVWTAHSPAGSALVHSVGTGDSKPIFAGSYGGAFTFDGQKLDDGGAGTGFVFVRKDDASKNFAVQVETGAAFIGSQIHAATAGPAMWIAAQVYGNARISNRPVVRGDEKQAAIGVWKIRHTDGGPSFAGFLDTEASDDVHDIAVDAVGGLWVAGATAGVTLKQLNGSGATGKAGAAGHALLATFDTNGNGRGAMLLSPAAGGGASADSVCASPMTGLIVFGVVGTFPDTPAFGTGKLDGGAGYIMVFKPPFAPQWHLPVKAQSLQGLVVGQLNVVGFGGAHVGGVEVGAHKLAGVATGLRGFVGSADSTGKMHWLTEVPDGVVGRVQHVAMRSDDSVVAAGVYTANTTTGTPATPFVASVDKAGKTAFVAPLNGLSPVGIGVLQTDVLVVAGSAPKGYDFGGGALASPSVFIAGYKL